MISIIKSSVKVSCGRQKFSRDPRRGASWERGLRRIIVWLQHEDSGGHEHEAEWAWSAWSIHMYVCKGPAGTPSVPGHTSQLRKSVPHTISFRTSSELGQVTDQKVGPVCRLYQAHAYASTRGSAPALSTPVFTSMMMAALDARDQGGATRNL